MGMGGRFPSFVKSYSSLFISSSEDVSDKARHYLSDLQKAGTRKTIERKVEVVLGSDYQAIQQFISNARVSAKAVTNQFVQDVVARIGDEKDSFLLFDETGFPKKGIKSVGVPQPMARMLR
jgi:SRSO17 transposase